LKAIIMAGGEGSRLRPLTCGLPKPLVPVLNRPIMHYIINLLKKHRFSDIGVTLQYMPEEIRSHFGNGSEYGVNLSYYVEETPLGTAGSVKNAAAFLDSTFIVISGDALTDFDLSRAMAFHRDSGSLATLVLTRVAIPLEYGVVITGRDGKIVRFLEKPGWGEVFSDTVNTGIYILEPEVLDYIPPGQKFDFSKDLFPLLLKEGRPLFGAVLDGYWCDIGDLTQYLQAHFDFLSGKVNLNIPAQQIKPGVFMEQDVSVNDSAIIEGPVYLGSGTVLGQEVRVEQFSVLGSGCSIQNGASIKRSVLWNNVFTGPGAGLRGAIIGSRVQVHRGSNIYEGAVIGNDCVIRERCSVYPDVKLWPCKIVETGTIVRESLVWSTRATRRLFGAEGMSGIANLEINPELAARAAAAFASALGTGCRVLVSSDTGNMSQMLKNALVCGLQSAGASVFTSADGTTPLHRFTVREIKCDGGVHVRASSRRPDAVNILFTGAKGGNIPRSLERKVENLLAREDFNRADSSQINKPSFVPAMPEAYLDRLLNSIDAGSIRRAGFRIAAAYDPQNAGLLLEPLCNKLNITLEPVFKEGKAHLPANWSEHRVLAEQAADLITGRELDFGVIIDAGADHFVIIDNLGRTVQEDMLLALIALMILRSRGEAVVVPVTATRAVERMASRYGARVIRTKTALQDFYEKMLDLENDAGSAAPVSVSQSLLHFDALAAVCKIAEYLATEKMSLSALIDEIPAYFMTSKETAVPWEAKGTVIRSIAEDADNDDLELLEGVKVYHPDGWALVLPDPDEPVCRVFSEGSTMEVAESLADFYIDKIISIAGAHKKAQ